LKGTSLTAGSSASSLKEMMKGTLSRIQNHLDLLFSTRRCTDVINRIRLKLFSEIILLQKVISTTEIAKRMFDLF
jgi:hypothetical protein